MSTQLKTTSVEDSLTKPMEPEQKFTVETVMQCPNWLLNSLWAADPCLFGSSMHMASLEYKYVPAAYSATGNPLFVSWSITYDGGKAAKKASPNKSWEWDELKTFFPDNKFAE